MNPDHFHLPSLGQAASVVNCQQLWQDSAQPNHPQSVPLVIHGSLRLSGKMTAHLEVHVQEELIQRYSSGAAQTDGLDGKAHDCWGWTQISYAFHSARYTAVAQNQSQEQQSENPAVYQPSERNSSQAQRDFMLKHMYIERGLKFLHF